MQPNQRATAFQDLWDWSDEADSAVHLRFPEPSAPRSRGPQPIEPAFPLVHRKEEAALDLDDAWYGGAFAAQPREDTFDDLFEEDARVSAVWNARKPRRVGVKVAGWIALVAAIAALAGLTRIDGARGEIARWATLGQLAW